jgi:hypothetical protein
MEAMGMSDQRKNRKSAKNERFKRIYRDRLERVKSGRENPKTAKEWAIWHRAVAANLTTQAKRLHDSAAINKPSPMNGKIVVIPPKAR